MFIICGPSGVGKGTVAGALMARDPDLYFSVSATTRTPRPGESDGVHYHFLTMEQFETWIAEDQFLEHAAYVGNRYGTPKKFVDEAMGQGRDALPPAGRSWSDGFWDGVRRALRRCAPGWREEKRSLTPPRTLTISSSTIRWTMLWRKSRLL